MDSANSNPGHAATLPTTTPMQALPRTREGNGAHRPPACRTSGRRHPTQHPRLDAIVCDINGVLILRDPTIAHAIERRHALAAGALADLMALPSTLLTTIGVLDHSTWLTYAYQSLPRKAVDEYLADRGTPDQQVADLLTRTAAAGVRTLLLANATARLRDNLAHHGLAGIAAHTYLSADIGYAKPDPRALTHLLHTEAVHPARTLLIDPDLSCVEAARTLGVRAHHYTGHANLRHTLIQRGVLT